MTYTQLSKPWKIAQPTDFHVCFLHQFRFVAHKQKHYTTSLWIFLPLRLYSRLNDFLNTCRKRKTAIDWQQFSFGWYSVRNTQCHSIQSRLHRLECYSSFQPSGAYPLLSVLLLHLAFLPFPLSDIPPYHEPKYQFRQRCSYNFPLVSRLKYSTLLDKFLQITTNFFTRNEKNDTA